MATGQMYQFFFFLMFCWNKAKAIYNGLSMTVCMQVAYTVQRLAHRT